MPWFVDWNNFRDSFEAEASQILGHTVVVNGGADATILPAPSLTFTDVVVSDADGNPMAKVERFEVTIELMPLLQGEIRVISMKLQRPEVTVRVAASGQINWLERGPEALPLDADRVILETVAIEDGALTYVDARSGAQRTFSGVMATVSARSLSGPWKVDDASYVDDGQRVQFSLATGRRLADGSIRVTADVQPPQWPVDLSADGKVGHDPVEGLFYEGTFAVREVNTRAQQGIVTPGWRSEGAFRLNGERLVIDRAIWSTGPPDRPLSLAGALSVDFGETPTFSASIEANQIDLDRTLGAGPSEPLKVPVAVERMVAWLKQVPPPAFHGRVAFNVPVIVMGGSIIQDLGFAASIDGEGLQISDLRARLPGQARLELSGRLRVAERVGFQGDVRLVVLQPATFAGWWRGRTGSEDVTGRLLSAFDLSGRADLRPGRISIDHTRTRIGSAEITGSFEWGEQAGGRRVLGADLDADRIDFVQLKALAEMLAGRDLDDAAILADDYQIRISADEFATEDLVVRDVVVDAAYTGDVLTVIQLAIGDIGGASYRVTSGQIKGATTSSPSGVLEGLLQADSLDGLTRLANRLAPDSLVAKWLTASGADLVPAVITTEITAPPEIGASGMRFTMGGVAGATTLAISVDANVDPEKWREEEIRVDLILDSPDSTALLNQLGIDTADLAVDPGGHIEIQGRGRPAEGIRTTIIAEIAGVIGNVSGSFRVDEDGTPAFSGTIGVSSDDIDPAVALLGLAAPGAALGTSLEAEDVAIEVHRGRVALLWQNAVLADRQVSGDVEWLVDPVRGWQLDGALSVSEIDLDWLTALGLGFAPVPTGNADAPWSRTPFASPAFGPIIGALAVESDHFYVSDQVDLVNSRFDVRLAPQRLAIDLTHGEVAGGQGSAKLAIHNVGGNARVAGSFDLRGAALGSFIWHRGDRAIATGTFDLQANFEATGRSPAGLVSSLTGGGAISIREGQARYLNPSAARPVIRESDVGQAFTEDSLRITLTDMLDADALDFGSTDEVFDIAAGTVRLKNISLRADKMDARGSAVLDFNTMRMDSDWTLSFDPGDTKVEGTIPKLGLVFRGRIAAPERFVDVLPFDSYLNMRLEARMLEIIELEEAARLEAGRLRRLVRKFEEDAVRREIARIEAEEAEKSRMESALASLAALDTLHTESTAAAIRKRERDVLTAADRAEQAAALARAWAEERLEVTQAARQAADAAAATLRISVEETHAVIAAAEEAANEAARTGAVYAQAEQELVDASERFGRAETELTAARTRETETTDVAAGAARRLELESTSSEKADALAAAVAETVAEARVAAEQASAFLSGIEEELDGAATTLADADRNWSGAEAGYTTAAAALGAAVDADIAAAWAVIETTDGLARAEIAATSAGQRATADRALRQQAIETLQTLQAALEEAEERAIRSAGAIDLAIQLGAQMTDPVDVTDTNRQLAATLETEARRQAAEAATAAETAGRAHAQAQSVLDAAAASAAESIEQAAARDNERRGAVAALANAQAAARLAAAARGPAEQAAVSLAGERDAAAAVLADARAAASDARQRRDDSQHLVRELASRLAGLLGEAQAANADRETTAKNAVLASDAARAAADTAEGAISVRSTAEDEGASAAEALARSESAFAVAEEEFTSAREIHDGARDLVMTTTAARDAAQDSAVASDSEAAVAEVSATEAGAAAEALSATAERARELAERVSGGLGPFDEPATYPDFQDDAGDTRTDAVGGAKDAALTTLTGSPVQSAEIAPPAPRLRPDQPLSITPTVDPSP